MSHVVLANQKLTYQLDGFYGFWALTRGLLAAGWRYKAMGDASTGGSKDTSASFLSERWGIGGGVNLTTTVQSGVAVSSITANTDGTATITFSGTTFVANSVGRFLTLAGDTYPTNNGTFRIVTFTSATSIKILNPGAVTEASPTVTAWSEKEGAANGTISTAGTGAATPGRAIFTIAVGTPFVAPVSSPLNRGSVGDLLTIAGATLGANNGTFRITRVISSSSVEIDNSAANGGGGETNNGTLIWTECSPTQQTYPFTPVQITSSTNATPIVVTTTTAQTFQTGDVVVIAGHTVNTNANGTWIIVSVSGTTFQLAGSTGNGAGGATGTALDMTHAQGMLSGAWENLQGPSTMKVFIGSNTASTAFYRGELVTQTTSGATGSILGVITDVGGGGGFLVIEPRLNGTAGGPRGWSTAADTVSASAAPTGSGATVTTSATTPIEFVRELVIWKASPTQGHIWTQCVDQSATESASRFSVLAGAAGVTNVVAPGGPAATFPAPGSYVIYGTANSGTATTGMTNWHNTGTTTYNAVQISCATCIENSTEGADGSWTVLQGVATTTPDGYQTTAFQRMDASEEGDVDPYVSFVLTAQASYAGTRTALTTNFGTAAPFMHASVLCGTGTTFGRGWRRRGFASTDAYQDFNIGLWSNGAAGNTASPLLANQTYPTKVANHPNPNLPVREPVWVVSDQTNQKMRKGYFRWWFFTEGGVCNRLLFNSTYIQIDSATSANPGPVAIGPWDGSTSPLNGS